MKKYPLLDNAFDPESFRQKGHDLIDQLANLMSHNQTGQGKVTETKSPEELLTYWQEYLRNPSDSNTLFQNIIDQSIKLHHPLFIGHQVSTPATLGVLSSLLSSYLNNGMGIYEMGEGATALEKIVVEIFCKQIGYEGGDGILTSGGTLANLTALLCARSNINGKNVWDDGTGDQYAIMVSEMAHYCVDRAVRIMGWGAQGIIKVPVNDKFTMDTSRLNDLYQYHSHRAIKIIGVVGSAPCTATGTYDDLNAIADFCDNRQLWFHVDGAHGGPAIFSKKYGHLMNGAQRADSVVIDAHKMMLTPALATALLFKNSAASYKTFNQKADYLWEAQEENEWHNIAKRTFECTKLMMCIKIFSLINEYGLQIFDDFVTRQYDLAREFADYLVAQIDFDLAVYPDSNIVCFRYAPDRETELSKLNRKIRQKILMDGTYYLVQTELNEGLYLRTTFMNTFTTMGHLRSMIDYVRKIGSEILHSSKQ